MAGVLGALVGAIALVVGASVVLLQTDFGAEAARRIALGRLNAAIAGRVTVGELHVRGRWIAFERAALHDPEGRVVARAERVEVALSPLALLRHRLDLEAVEVDGPELYLVRGARGANLARALAPRHPRAPRLAGAPPLPSGEASALSVAVRSLTVVDGVVDVPSLAAAGARHARVAGIALAGRGHYDGTRSLAEGEVEAVFDGGRVEARGEIDLATLRARGAGVTVRGLDLDLARLLPGVGPASDLAFELHVDGGGRDLAGLDGSLLLTVPPSELGGHALGPIRLRARAAGARYEVAELHAALPGMELSGHGTASARDVDAHLRVEASDLGVTAASLAPPGGPPPLELAGRGRVDLALTGSLHAPALRAAGHFPSLRAGGGRVRDLALAAEVPDVRRPGAGYLAVIAPEASVGERTLRGVEVSARTAGARIAASARTTAPYPLSLRLVARRASARSATLEALTVRYAEATWTLARPARLEAGHPAGWAVRGLALRAAGQAVRVDAAARAGGGLDAHLGLSALDLGRLPRILAPARLGLRGVVDARVDLSGTVREPRGHVAVDARGVAGDRFPPTDGRLELDLGGRAIDARLRVVREQHPLLVLVGRLGAGASALRQPARLAEVPLTLRAVVGPLAIQRLGLPAKTDRDPPRALRGVAHADVTIEGTPRAPRAVVHLDVADVRLDRDLVGSGHVELKYADEKADLDARLLSTNGGLLRVRSSGAHVDLGYPAVLRFDPRQLPLDVRVDADRFDLQGLSGAAEGLRTVGGRLGAAATIRGTVDDPRLSGRLELTDGLLAVTGLGEWRGIHLAAHGDERKVTLDDLSLDSGSGHAHASGTAERGSGPGYAIAARAEARAFPVYREGQPLATASLQADVRGALSPRSTRLSIDVADARIALSDARRKELQPLEAPRDVVLVERGEPLNRAQAEKLRGAPAAAPARASARVVRAVVNAPRKLWVTGKDAYLELGLSPGFRVSSAAGATQVLGQVVVQRGRVDVLGRRFDLKAGSTVDFAGPPDRPVLDVSAQHQNENENVTVQWTAKGPLDHLAVAVSSPNRPDLTESQLYTLVITGHLELGGGTSGASSPSAEAASFLGHAFAAEVQKTLAKKLPLDVLTIDAGSGEGLTGTSLEAGRYVTDKLYVGYVGRVGADPTRYQNRNAVHVEYQLSSRWGIDGEYGDAGTGSADLLWKKSY
jgi:autotransporter translocation and assembly factor TamB